MLRIDSTNNVLLIYRLNVLCKTQLVRMVSRTYQASKGVTR